MVYAEENWWGTSVESEIRAKLYHNNGLDYVDSNPWRGGSVNSVVVPEHPRERAARDENRPGGKLIAESKLAEAVDGSSA